MKCSKAYFFKIVVYSFLEWSESFLIEYLSDLEGSKKEKILFPVLVIVNTNEGPSVRGRWKRGGFVGFCGVVHSVPDSRSKEGSWVRIVGVTSLAGHPTQV